MLLPTGTCTPYSETWPKAGMIVDGAAYRLSQPVRPTSETGSGLWPTPNTAPERPCEGNVRMLRQKVLAGDMTEAEARAMLGGKSPFEAQGVIPAMASTAQQSPIETGSHLSPDWVEWLMGWPIGWTSLEPMTELGSWFGETWWDEEPVPRITTDKTNRTKRLRAIGNGQVPACVVSAWLTLGVMVASEGKHGRTAEHQQWRT